MRIYSVDQKTTEIEKAIIWLIETNLFNCSSSLSRVVTTASVDSAKEVT